MYPYRERDFDENKYPKYSPFLLQEVSGEDEWVIKLGPEREGIFHVKSMHFLFGNQQS